MEESRTAASGLDPLVQASSAALKLWMSAFRPAALISLRSHRVRAQSPALAHALITELYLDIEALRFPARLASMVPASVVEKKRNKNQALRVGY